MPLLVDEAHYVAGGENVVDQIATHRAAGLEPAFGLQYFAQLGSASEHQQKILKGVLNLLQSRFLFRMGDAEDAEQATRIAMAVYATMIRDDPDSRARLRVTPEQALNFPNYYCLASWIATRHPGAELHGPDLPAARRRRRMGRASPRVARASASGRTPSSSSRRSQVIRPQPVRIRRSPRLTPMAGSPPRRGARASDAPGRRRRRSSAFARNARSSTRCRSTTSHPRARDTDLTDSPVRRIVGRRTRAPTDARGRPAGRPTRCASSRSSTGSTRSAPPTSSSTTGPACPGSTTRTTRSSRCSTASASRP